jgi:hypothetical protein
MSYSLPNFGVNSGHKTSVWVWDVFMACVDFWGSVWLCAWATADGGSGSSTVVFSK